LGHRRDDVATRKVCPFDGIPSDHYRVFLSRIGQEGAQNGGEFRRLREELVFAEVKHV
jgi:hypothetical protein